MIPKLIIQVYASSIPMPGEIRQNIEHIKTINTGYQHKLFDETAVREYIQNNSWPELLEQIDRINPKYFVVLLDIFRYLILYKEGGVYLDIKSTLSAPLDDVLLSSDLFLLPDNAYNIFLQWCVISVPNHPYLKLILDTIVHTLANYQYQIDGVGEKGVFNVSGSGMYSRCILSLFNPSLHRIVNLSTVGIKYTIFNKSTAHKLLFNKPHYTTLLAKLVI